MQREVRDAHRLIAAAAVSLTSVRLPPFTPTTCRPSAGGHSGSAPFDATPSPPGLRRAGSGLPFPSTASGSSGNGSNSNGSNGNGSGGLMRTHSLKRELGIPQLEAAQSLRRAMSCYPELAPDGGEGAAAAPSDGHSAGELLACFLC